MNNLPQGVRVPPVPGLHGMPGNVVNGAINGGISGAMGGHAGAGAGGPAGAGRGVSFAGSGGGAGAGPGAAGGPGPQPMQMPIRQPISSTRISDITVSSSKTLLVTTATHKDYSPSQRWTQRPAKRS